MISSLAAQQFEAAAAHYDQAAVGLQVVAERVEDCVQAIVSGSENIRWQSAAGQAFTAATHHHVQQCRSRQSRILEMSTSARTIAADLREQAHRARVLALAVDAAASALAAAGAEQQLKALVHGARSASESAEGFLRFVQTHGGLPLARLDAARG